MSISGVGSGSAQQWDLASSLFSKLDTKGQGYIDQSELQSAFDQVDGDGQDATTDATNFMQAMDANGDGQISQQELSSGLQQVSDALNAQFDSARVARAGGNDSQSPSIDDIFSSLDTKNQGYIDKDELQTALTQATGGSSSDASQQVDQIFQALDTDGNGQISKAELSAGLDKLAAAGGAASATSTGSTPGTDAQDGTAVTASAATTGTSTAHAGGAHGSGGASDDSQSYAPADTNHDGVVSPEELAAYEAAHGGGTSTDGTAQTGSNLDAIMKIVSQLAQAYGQSADTSSTDSTISAIA